MHHRPVVLKLDLHSTVIDTDVSSQGRLYCTFLCGDPSGIIKMPTSDKAGTVSFDLVALRLSNAKLPYIAGIRSGQG